MLFFGFGFVTCLNSLLTPLFKQGFHFSHFEANLVSAAFFFAYFMGSLFYVLSDKTNNKIFKMFNNLGYKKLILFGLIMSATGNLVFAISVILPNLGVVA